MHAAGVKKGMIGLDNLGNTCYANAAIQALRHQVDLTMFLFQKKHHEILQKKKEAGEKQYEVEFVGAYADLIHQLWSGDGPAYVRPEGFWLSMLRSAEKAGFEHFRMRAPHDSQEFLMFLLDQIHEGLKESVTMSIADRTRTPLINEALQTWKNFFEKQYSPLVELVFTLQLNGITCTRCSTTFNRWETNNMIKVSVPELTSESQSEYTILDLLKRECKEEEIDGYHCDTCGNDHRTRAIRRHTFWRLGNWCIIVLKRNSNTGYRINTRVKIPLTQIFTDVFHSESTEISRFMPYNLFAVINHHGGATGGHYTSQARNPMTGEWNLFDDEKVYPLHSGPHLDESAYILFYRQQPDLQLKLDP